MSPVPDYITVMDRLRMAQKLCIVPLHLIGRDDFDEEAARAAYAAESTYMNHSRMLLRAVIKQSLDIAAAYPDDKKATQLVLDQALLIDAAWSKEDPELRDFLIHIIVATDPDTVERLLSS